MKFSASPLSGCHIIELDKRVDERGYFARTWCRQELAEHGLSMEVAQVNVGVSTKTGTLRGMHYQLPPHAEIKIVRCSRGAAYDVAVDLRPDSPTFRRWYGVELTHDSGRMLYVPEGCAHGYLTLAADTELLYFTSHAYAPGAARGVRYDDPAFGIEWPAPVRVVSNADATWPDFQPGDEHDHR
ncbi:MAG TPA: dTDP-4-dehydrorhamnose 3,5-epimerase family protein [Gammaproteobacteria bacterium]|nr:dTDP-4-dehydrorhamnose 3,5-epimerase family protein [Gammaproteobacteria bacterium]